MNLEKNQVIVRTFSTFKYDKNIKLPDIIPIAIKKNDLWVKGEKNIKNHDCDEFVLTLAQINKSKIAIQPLSTRTIKGMKLINKI